MHEAQIFQMKGKGREEEGISFTCVSSSVALKAPAGAVCTAQGRGTNLSWGWQTWAGRGKGCASTEEQLPGCCSSHSLLFDILMSVHRL